MTTVCASILFALTACGEADWDGAGTHVGEKKKVCGPVESVRHDGGVTFVNVGEDYPSPERFVIVLWNDETFDVGNWDRFPWACITGRISEYDGVAQIETYDSADIEISYEADYHDCVDAGAC